MSDSAAMLRKVLSGSAVSHCCSVPFFNGVDQVISGQLSCRFRMAQRSRGRRARVRLAEVTICFPAGAGVQQAEARVHEAVKAGARHRPSALPTVSSMTRPSSRQSGLRVCVCSFPAAAWPVIHTQSAE